MPETNVLQKGVVITLFDGTKFLINDITATPDFDPAQDMPDNTLILEGSKFAYVVTYEEVK